MKRSVMCLALFTFTLGAPAFAAVDSDFPEAVDKPVVIQLAGVWNSFDTQARLDVSRGGLVSVGTSLDLEALFGVPTTQVDFRGDGSWRISKRNYIDFGYSALNRSGSRALEGDIVWNGYTYKAGVTVDGKFNNYLRVRRLALRHLPGGQRQDLGGPLDRVRALRDRPQRPGTDHESRRDDHEGRRPQRLQRGTPGAAHRDRNVRGDLEPLDVRLLHPRDRLQLGGHRRKHPRGRALVRLVSDEATSASWPGETSTGSR